MKDNTLILGCGYTGTFYLAKFKDADWTSRIPSVARPSQLPDEVNKDIREPICFNLVDRSTWTNIPDSKNVLWTFAIRDSHEGELALEFFEAHLKNRNVIVYSSTSAYKFETQNEEVTENHPLKLEQARFLAEEKLREKGALILHLSGIIGEDRYPKKWYENRLVKYASSILNYIHVDDIVFFTDLVFKNFKAGERLNLTSGDYKTHREIADLLKVDAGFVHEEGTVDSKKISNSKILSFLNLGGYKFRKYPEDCM